MQTLLFAVTFFAQSVTPTFDVASVRACRDEDRRAQMPSGPGNMRLVCWPLRRIIQDAYDLFSTGAVNPLNPAFPMTPLEAVPAWVDSTSYTVLAKSSNNESLALMRGPMMQRLLEDRFQLKIKRQTREVPVYLMTVARPGKLTPTRPGSCNPLDPTDQTQHYPPPDAKPFCIDASPQREGSKFTWDVKGITLTVLASRMHPDGLPVVNRTGIDGSFDIHLEWARTPIPPRQTIYRGPRCSTPSRTNSACASTKAAPRANSSSSSIFKSPLKINGPKSVGPLPSTARNEKRFLDSPSSRQAPETRLE